MKPLLPLGSRTYLRPGPTPKMPPGLEELMEGMTREVLRHNPSDIYDFCSKHIENLIHIRDSHIKSSRPFNKLTLEDKIKKAQNKIHERALQRIKKIDIENEKNKTIKTIPTSLCEAVDDDTIVTIKNATELAVSDKSLEDKLGSINLDSTINSTMHEINNYKNTENVKELIDVKTSNEINLLVQGCTAIDGNDSIIENVELSTSMDNEIKNDQDHEHKWDNESILNIENNIKDLPNVDDDIQESNIDIAHEIKRGVEDVNIESSKVSDNVKKNIDDVDVDEVNNLQEISENAYNDKIEHQIVADNDLTSNEENKNTFTEKPNEIHDFTNRHFQGKSDNDVDSNKENIIYNLKKDSLELANSIDKLKNYSLPSERTIGINDSTDTVNKDDKESLTPVDLNKEQESYISAGDSLFNNIIVFNNGMSEICTGEKSDIDSNPNKKEILVNVPQDVVSDNTINILNVSSQNIGDINNENITDINNENITDEELINEYKEKVKNDVDLIPETKVNVIKDKNDVNDVVNLNTDDASQDNENMSADDNLIKCKNNFNVINNLNTDDASEESKNIPVVNDFKNVDVRECSGNEMIHEKSIDENMNNKNNLKINKIVNNSLETITDLNNDTVKLKDDSNTFEKNIGLKINFENPDKIEKKLEINGNKSHGNPFIHESQTKNNLGGEVNPCIPDVIHIVDNKVTDKTTEKCDSINSSECTVKSINEPSDFKNNSICHDDTLNSGNSKGNNETLSNNLQNKNDSKKSNGETHTFDLDNKSCNKIESTNDNDLNFVSNADNSKSADNQLKKQSSMDLETAAITIQKVFRSFMFKSRSSTLDEIPNYDESVDIPYMPLENEITLNNRDFITPNTDRRTMGISRMDTVLQTVNEEKSLSLSTDDSSTLSSAATTIQAHVRGFLVRNRLNSNKTNSSSSMMNSDGLSMDTDNEGQKNKTVLNIHIVPEGGQFISRDDSIGTTGDLSFDVSPRSSNLHPLGYDRNERRKQLKREDAIQSVSPPSNNSGKLSEDVESVKEFPLINNETLQPEIESTVQLIEKSQEVKDVKEEDDSLGTSPSKSTTANTVIEVINNENVENRRERLTKMSSDEMDVVTPYINSEETLSTGSQSSRLLHSGEFHDMVLPTRVSRTESSVVREFQNVLVYFLRWNG